MSEYQYFEFQAMDRRLGEKEMKELRFYSSRATITPTSFVNEYSYGDFKGNADAWMEKYFDGFLYLANWGTHKLQLRLPAKLLSRETARLYCPGEAASVSEKSGNLIFTFLSEDEGGGEWIDGNGVLTSILPVRSDLARGDLRALYVGWLLCVQDGGLDDDEIEPPVPPNLGKLTRALSSLIDFLRVDQDLVSVAAQSSRVIEVPSIDRDEISEWVASLPAKEKDDILIRIMEGEDAHVGSDLCSRFNRDRAPHNPTVEPRRRTVGELMATARALEQKRRLDENRKAAQEKAHREQQAAVAREKHLDSITGRVAELWMQIEQLIATKQPKSYDLAVQHLADLRDLAVRQGTGKEFASRVAALREAHARKPSFATRLLEKGM